MSLGQRTVALSFAGLLLGATIVGCGGGAGPMPAADEGRYEDPDFAPTVDLHGAVPEVKLGGYTFTNASHILTHPHVNARPSSAAWIFYGLPAMVDDHFMSVSPSYGGLVKGVKTIRGRYVSEGEGVSGGIWDRLLWYAQDSVGNVHVLKRKILRSPEGTAAAHYIGVAGGEAASFLIPNNPTVGKTWDIRFTSTEVDRYKVVADGVTLAGTPGLLRMRGIADVNDDGTFDPRWDGDDERWDVYALPGKGIWADVWTKNANYGYIRSR